MNAVVRAARGGLGARRLQAVIIGLVVLAATAASTLALGMLADAHSPFDHAFAAQHGANITATVDPSRATPAQLAATTHLPGVTAAAGPYAQLETTADLSTPGLPGSRATPLRIVGRTSPGGQVDVLTLDAGRWMRNDREIVLSRDAPGRLGSTVRIGSRTLTVVGVADSVTNTAQAWVLPSAIAALGGTSSAGRAQMLYRFAHAGSAAAIAADAARLRAALPHRALLSTASSLDVRQSEQSAIAPWVPFIVAFGVIALAISMLIVVNVVGGAVIAGTTRIGVLKAIGFTPAQVVASYVLLVTVPAVLGCVAGAVCGNLLAIPLLAQNARVYQVGVLGIPFWVDAVVPLGVLALTVIAAVLPALRAGRMSAVQAIATGRAPRPAHGYGVHRRLARLRALPRTVTLGLAAPFARPARTLVTAAAVAFGAAAVTFGFGLATSLNRAFTDLSESSSLPVQVSAIPQAPAPSRGGGGKLGRPGITAAQQRAMRSAIAAQAGTRHVVSKTESDLSLPGLTHDVAVTAYGGNPAWTGLALNAGRWYSSAARAREVVANTLFLTDTGTSVGSTYTLLSGGRRTTVRIVGEVFRPGNDLQLYLSPATLRAVDPGAAPDELDVALTPGTNAGAYTNTVSARLGRSYYARTVSGPSTSSPRCSR